jgi:hypothetical protein
MPNTMAPIDMAIDSVTKNVFVTTVGNNGGKDITVYNSNAVSTGVSYKGAEISSIAIANNNVFTA